MRAGALLSVVFGLVLLGMCVSQWNSHTGSNLVQGVTAYGQGDKAGLSAMNQESSLNDTARTGLEGFIGIFWVGVGIFLWRKDVATRMGQVSGRNVPRNRR